MMKCFHYIWTEANGSVNLENRTYRFCLWCKNFKMKNLIKRAKLFKNVSVKLSATATNKSNVGYGFRKYEFFFSLDSKFVKHFVILYYSNKT